MPPTPQAAQVANFEEDGYEAYLAMISAVTGNRLIIGCGLPTQHTSADAAAQRRNIYDRLSTGASTKSV